MSEPKKKKPPRKDEDEVTIAKSILDEIIEETENEDEEKEPLSDAVPSSIQDNAEINLFKGWR